MKVKRTKIFNIPGQNCGMCGQVGAVKVKVCVYTYFIWVLGTYIYTQTHTHTHMYKSRTHRSSVLYKNSTWAPYARSLERRYARIRLPEPKRAYKIVQYNNLMLNSIEDMIILWYTVSTVYWLFEVIIWYAGLSQFLYY